MIKTINLISKFAHKDKNSAFSNVYASKGIIQAFDGVCGISVNMPFDIDFCCNAEKLSNVLSKCDPDNVKLKTNKGKLEISSGKLKSKIDLFPLENYPYFAKGDGDKIETGNIIEELKLLSSFANPDDVRVFIQGVHIKNKSISATNGHTVVIKESDIETDNEIIVPVKSILKFAAAKIDCNQMMYEGTTAYFPFAADGGFFFTKTIDSKIPDMSKMIRPMKDSFSIGQIKDDLKTIASLCGDDKTVIIGDGISTRDGSTIISGIELSECAFSVDYLVAISEIADNIDLSYFPDVCPFESEGIKGAIAGIKI